MISPAFGSVQDALQLELTWQSTPALWMATRPDLCWCEDCRGKHTKGFGKTPAEAIADFHEQEGSLGD